MALGYLFILAISLFILSMSSVVLLWTIKSPKATKNIIYITTCFSLLLTYINVTALPSNYVLQQVIGYLLGGFALVGLFMVYRKQITGAKILICFSIIANFIQIFFL